MKKFVDFLKLSGSGNDFVVIDSRKHIFPDPVKISLAKRLCKRETGIGADGIIFIENSDIAELKMRYFNSDGSEAKMCGNGARCTAWAGVKFGMPNTYRIETLSGVLSVSVNGESVKVEMPSARLIAEDIELTMDEVKMKIDLWDTGVPHAVIFNERIDNIPVDKIGRYVRFHQIFAPNGTNVDFVQIRDEHNIYIRTYERGVERETLACGTGAVASALAGAYKSVLLPPVNVLTKLPDTLVVEFGKAQSVTQNIMLSGSVIFCFEGRFYL